MNTLEDIQESEPRKRQTVKNIRKGKNKTQAHCKAVAENNLKIKSLSVTSTSTKTIH